jgi:hypothetical protein
LYHDSNQARTWNQPRQAERRQRKQALPARRNPILSRRELREEVIAILG